MKRINRIMLGSMVYKNNFAKKFKSCRASLLSKVVQYGIGRTLVFISAVLFFVHCSARTSSNMVDQLFLHKGNRVDRLVGYCAQKPVIKDPIVMATDAGQQYTLIIENCGLSKRARDKVEVITKRRKRDEHKIAYTTSIEERDGNLVIIFTYNPARIEISYVVENSIKGIPTLVISMHDKRQNQHSSVSLNKPGVRVVIDCGHGGRDVGAVGIDGVQEKDITLAIGQKVSGYLEKQGFMPFMQRTSVRDNYIALDDRTTFANLTAYADIVLSLHANSSPSNSAANGLETYALDKSLVGAQVSGLRLQQEQQKVCESLKLARAIHSTLVGHDKHNRIPHDRGIKQALTQILLGVEAPAVLIELGFVTNPEESKALQDPEYQDFLAQRIVQGVKNYLSISSHT